jgi:PAS domain S-box-containing protein
MNRFKQKYKLVLQSYLTNFDEKALYQANELCKEFIHMAIAPEELVALHYETVQEITKDLPAETALQIINRCLAYLLEVMVTYGINCGRGGYSRENLDRWHDAVNHLSSSLNLFENKHKVILDTIPTAVSTVNRDGVITFVNKKMEELFGFKAADVLGKNYIDVVCGGIKISEDGKYTSLVMETLETGRVFTNVEREYPGGLVFRLNTSIIRDGEGNLSEVIVSIQDITESKQLEHAVMCNEKLAAVGSMAAGIAHEIRNPLTAVRGFIQLLHAQPVQSKKKEYIDIIIEEIDRANTVLKDFLSFAKPAFPKRQLVGVLELLEEIRLLTESEALLREINLDFSYAMELPDMYIDKDQLKQVLLNIIKNAFDAVEAHGRVGVTAVWKLALGKVSIIVEDNGMGMDQKTVSRIFDPFFTTKDTGTGLGMAVSYQIIKNHDGEINVESTPGNGTTFNVILPVVQIDRIRKSENSIDLINCPVVYSN